MATNVEGNWENAENEYNPTNLVRPNRDIVPMGIVENDSGANTDE